MNAFNRALEYWANDEPLPLDLAVELMTEGYDVESLEAEHRQ